MSVFPDGNLPLRVTAELQDRRTLMRGTPHYNRRWHDNKKISENYDKIDWSSIREERKKREAAKKEKEKRRDG